MQNIVLTKCKTNSLPLLALNIRSWSRTHNSVSVLHILQVQDQVLQNGKTKINFATTSKFSKILIRCEFV